jgi:hypothetical protein
VEKGLIPLNESLHERMHAHEVRRQEILVEIARLRHQKEMPLAKLSKKHITAFCTALKELFQEKASDFGKEYLRLLLDEIRVTKKEVHLQGSHAALASALSCGSNSGFKKVPRFDQYWLPVCNPLHNRSLSPAVNQKPSISTCYQRSGRSRRTGSGIKSHFRSWCHQGTALPVVELSQFMPQNGDGHECRIPFVIQNLGSRRFPMSTVRRSPDIRWKTRNRVRSYLG